MVRSCLSENTEYMHSKLLGVFLFLCVAFSAHSQKGFRYLFSGNTLSQTCVRESDGNRTEVEIMLNKQAKLSKVELAAELQPLWSLIGLTGFPVDFSKQTTQTFSISDGKEVQEVSMTVRQIKSRTAPFSIQFTPSYPVSAWSNSTMGWSGCGLLQDETGTAVFAQCGASFFIAFSGKQDLLSFEIRCVAADKFSGLFSVEAAATGVNDWMPLKIMDDCRPFFDGEVQKVRLRLPAGTALVRFVLYEVDEISPVSLNAFSVETYDGDPVDNELPSEVEQTTVPNYGVRYQPFSETVLFPEEMCGNGYVYRISDFSGRTVHAGKVNENRLSLRFLPVGSYVLTGAGGDKKTFSLKFIKER